MNRFLIDTDTFTHYLRYDPAVFTTVLQHRSELLGIPIIVIEEMWNGWQAAIKRAKTPELVAIGYQQLSESLTELRNWQIQPYTADAMRIFNDLRRAKLNVGASDLRIAATTLSVGATLVTRNARDFNRVPGLKIVDWTTHS